MGDETNLENVVQSSRDYDKFVLILNNRDTNRGHIEKLKQAFQETGNLTQVQPILVNEKYEIIDGQHRFTAARDLNEPVYFTMKAGLGIKEARSMNILHRSWTAQDFAESYAVGGDPNYVRYLKFKEDYGFNHTILLDYITGAHVQGAASEFRRGDFVFTEEMEPQAKARLDMLAEVLELAPSVKKDYHFADALLSIVYLDGFSIPRLMSKLEKNGTLLHKFGTKNEYLRVLEELYNFGYSDENRMRLY